MSDGPLVIGPVWIGPEPDAPYTYDVPSVDGTSTATGIFGDIILENIYRQQVFDLPKQSIIEQYNKEKNTVTQRLTDAINTLLKPITDSGGVITEQDRINAINSLSNQLSSNLSAYEKTLETAANVPYGYEGGSNFLYIIWEKMPFQVRREYPFEQLAKEELERTAAYYKKDIITDSINFLNQQLIEQQGLLAQKEQARLAAKAEAQRVAAEAAEQARLAAEAIRVANTFRAPGSASAAGPLFMTSAGTVAVVEAAAVTLQAAIRAAITALGGLVASVGAGFAVGISALFYSTKLANGELPERYAFSTPLTDLAPNHGQDLNAIAAAGGTVDLPYRISSKTAADGQSEVFVVKTDGVTVPSKVRVVAATYDATQKIYTATTADVPPRTLTWTPIVNPGNSSTTSPAEQPAPPVYTGATVTPVEGRIDTFPAVSEASFDDFITVFPAGSGLPPIYTMFRDRREDAGVATGVGQPVSGNWLGAASQGEGTPIPSQIADQLRGKEFKNFREFRETLWKAVANDPELSKQFNPGSLAVMKDGSAAYVRESEQVGGRVKFEIHHKNRIIDGGGVYDIDNLVTVTPKRHIEIHSGGK